MAASTKAKGLDFHPLSAEFPLMPDDQLAFVVASMEAHGFDPRFPIVLFQKKILDGRNRYRASTIAKVKPRFFTFTGTEEQAQAFVIAANENRRHLLETWLQARRKERIERVRAAVAAGDSTRDIAEHEVVSQTQIQRDLHPGETLEPPPVHPSSPPEKPDENERASNSQTLCSRCQRVGAVPNCQMCKEENTPKNAPKRKSTVKPSKAMRDAFGNEVPDRCRAAYADPWVQDAIDFLATMSAKFWGERLADGLTKRKKHYPHFNVKDFVDGCGMAGDTLDKLLEHLKERRPAGVCPACDGKGCAKCSMSGLVYRELYQKLKAKK